MTIIKTWEGPLAPISECAFPRHTPSAHAYGGELIGLAGKSTSTATRKENSPGRRQTIWTAVCRAPLPSVVTTRACSNNLEETVEQFSTLHSNRHGDRLNHRLAHQSPDWLEIDPAPAESDAAGHFCFSISPTLSLEYENGMGFPFGYRPPSHPPRRKARRPAAFDAADRRTFRTRQANLPPSFQEMIQREGFVAYPRPARHRQGRGEGRAGDLSSAPLAIPR